MCAVCPLQGIDPRQPLSVDIFKGLIPHTLMTILHLNSITDADGELAVWSATSSSPPPSIPYFSANPKGAGVVAGVLGTPRGAVGGYAKLADLCEGRLAAYPTTLAEDLQMLRCVSHFAP